jgi:membrane protease YdiL (CAAX protease family)
MHLPRKIPTMTLRPIPPPVCLAVALIPMVVSQILRLHQSDPAAWIFWDYAGRLGGMAALAAIPSARVVAFRLEPLRVTLWEAAVWIAGLVLADHYLGGWIRRTVNAALPGTVLGVYPEAQGWLHIADGVVGLALVAISEEVVFRRYARHAFQNLLGDGVAMLAVTSILFAVYHWWTGIGNICEALFMGVLLMLFYRRAGALWPAIVAHYLVDMVDFAI